MPLTRYNARMARLDTLEARYLPLMRAALIRAVEPCADAAEQGASPTVAAALVRISYVVDVLASLYEQCGTAEAQEEYDYLTSTYGQAKALPGFATVATWAQRLRQFISTEGALAVRGITEATRAIVKRVLTTAADDGLGVDEAGRLLRAEVATLSVARGVSIVRTELIAASNIGSLLGAEATGLKLDKFWLATPGPRTRPTHAAADGQTVGLRDSFTVGGESARYPGDPLLSAGERIRCRCSLGYKPG